ncbi:AIPR family protein [Streptosporangium sp. NPDC023825]|uniref:AIPR family protein n=1 Tax=Streptosporangium sp. NPDC023825 TaxID=3154909 RepID=UPI003448BEF2
MAETDIGDFAHNLINTVLDDADAEGVTAPEMFIQLMLDNLEIAGEVENTFIAYHKAHGLEIYGYGFNDTLRSLDLFVADFRHAHLNDKLLKAQADTLFKRALTFLHRCEDVRKAVDESSDVYDMCVGVQKNLPDAARIRIFLITNCFSTSRAPDSTRSGEIDVTYELWDLPRFHRLASSGTQSEPIVVEFDEPLMCLAAPSSGTNWSVVLGVIPGQLLADLYGKYGTRLLELNVRSFLQARVKVNKGIRDTLLRTPEWFMAYNNGITATASMVDFTPMPGGFHAITRIHGLQIVNGGQTTASIYYAHTRDEADLADVHVQMKLTVLPEELLEKVVPDISKYSNSQNAVTLVDFSSNHPYHVNVERVTRSLWAPAVDGSGQETRWFYERARGQYTDALTQAGTTPRQKKFRLVHPTNQKFSKADLAKYLNSWDQLPYHVSKGAQKNFAEFMSHLTNLEEQGRMPLVDVRYCQRLIAKATLFKEIDKIAREVGAGSHKSHITTYTMARLSLATDRRIDLDRIWRDQGLTPALTSAVRDLCPMILRTVTRPLHGNNVGEWAKKSSCWEAVSKIKWEVPDSLTAELLPGPVVESVSSTYGEHPDLHDDVAIVAAVPPEEWLAIQRWAKETHSLEPDHRQHIAMVSRRLESGQPIKSATARKALLIRSAAINAGFNS